MKKEYKTPLMEIVNVKSNIQLLAGSGGVEGNPSSTDYEQQDVEF